MHFIHKMSLIADTCVHLRNRIACASARRKTDVILAKTCRYSAACNVFHRITPQLRVLTTVNQHTVSRMIYRRTLSSKKESNVDTFSKDVHPPTDQLVDSARSSTTREVLWGYSKQLSSRLYVFMRDSASDAMSWVGAKAVVFAERSKGRITEKIQSSVEAAKTSVTNRTQVLQESIKSSMRSSIDSLVQTILRPLNSFGNYVANVWKTTPIWNRFFWWSLSAIAVYGMATTVPKEIVKQVIVSTATVEKPATGSKSMAKSEHDASELPPEN